MVQKYLFMKQQGEGCDYTIGCGEKLVPLRNGSDTEINEIIQCYNPSNDILVKCMVMELISDAMTIYEKYLKTKESKQQEEEKQKIIDEIAELQEKLSKLGK